MGKLTKIIVFAVVGFLLSFNWVNVYASPLEMSVKEHEMRYTDGPMDGGWWARGVSGINLISEYKHYTMKGRASCRNGLGSFSDGGWKNKNQWSKARVLDWGFGNKVYYDKKK